MPSVLPLLGASLLLGAAPTALALRLGGPRWLLPALQALAFFPLATWILLEHTLGIAWAAEMLWALGATLVLVPWARARPQLVDQRIVNARPYREEMFRWIETGVGPESEPRKMILQHLRQTAAYAAAALATANLGGLFAGALLLNWMNAYVGAYARTTGRPLTAAILAWNVWSVVRVAAFVLLGVGAASVTLAFAGLSDSGPDVVAWLPWVLAGLVLDLVLKAALGPLASRWLRALRASGTAPGPVDSPAERP